MANVFDQFDADAGPNVFDQFDAMPPAIPELSPADPVAQIMPGVRRAEQQALAPDRPFKNYKGEPVPESESGMFSEGDPDQQRFVAELAASFIEIPGLSEAARLRTAATLGKFLSRFTKPVTGAAQNAAASAGVSETMGGDSGDAALAAGAGRVAGEGVAALGSKVLSPVVSTMKEGAEAALRTVRGAGETLLPSRAVSSPIVAMMEAAAETSLLGAKTMATTAKSAEEVAEREIESFATNLTRGMSKEDIGAVIKDSVEESSEAFRTMAGAKYAQIDRLTGNTLVDFAPVIAQAEKLLADSRRGLRTAEVENVLKQIIEKGDTVDWATAAALRSDLLRIGRSSSELVQGKVQGFAKDMAKTIDNEMATSAKELSGEAFDAWRAANEFYKEGAQKFGSRVMKNIARNDPEAVYTALIKEGKPGSIRAVRQELSPEDWAPVQGQFIADLMQKTNGQGKALQRQLSNWEKSGALEQIFPTMAERNAVREVFRTMELTQNRTAKALSLAMGIGQYAAIIGLPAGVITGNTSATATAAGTLIAPALLARILSSRVGSKWLTQGLKAPPGSAEGTEAAAKLAAFIMSDSDGPE